MISLIFAGREVKCWVSSRDDIEESAQVQISNVASLPFLFHNVAIMPDVHCGYGVPIGCVFAATGNVIVPNAVGVDIGCGMRTCRTDITDISTDHLKKIMGTIRETVPVGFAHNEYANHAVMPDSTQVQLHAGSVVASEYASAAKQIGSLGGGNHFIEIQRGDDGFVWLMIHSGSRNLGKKIADHYCAVAKQRNAEWFSSVPEKHDLAFLPLSSEEGQMYLAEMNYALDFAKANRALMMDRIMNAVVDAVDGQVAFDDELDVHHNYARMENHMGHNVMVHRKGATSARDGELGIIPGSQGTASYIVRGKGNVLSFNSCSHGAGRKMGRKQAQRELSLDTEKKLLDEQGIVHSIRNVSDLDEAAGAYKDIDLVMANQAELVDVVTKLKPLAVIKG